MATSGFRSNDEENNVESLLKWPLEYVKESKEYICGWCGQVLIPNHTALDLETHFKSCKNNNENGLLMIFEELRKLNHKLEGLDDDVQLKVDKMKAEVMEEIKNEVMEEIKNEVMEEIKAEVMEEIKNEMVNVKSEVKKDLETQIKRCEIRDGVLPTLFWKVKSLEEKMVEMKGRVSGVTETISTVVRSVLEAKGTSTADTTLLNELDRLKKESEAVWTELRKSERENQSTKTGMENFSEQLKVNDREVQTLKLQMENERTEIEETRHLAEESFPFQQLAITMDNFNLSTHNYLFQPSFRWTIDGIEALTAQKTFQLNSELFQWNGYPVQARAKLQLKENDCVYISLCLDDMVKYERELKDFKIIPQIYYILKNTNRRYSNDKGVKAAYGFNTAFKYSLGFKTCLGHKSWFDLLSYCEKDFIDIEIYVEPFSMAQLVHSYDGTLVWVIENYKKRLQSEKDMLVFNQESAYFYTGPKGYRVQMKIKLNGIKGGVGPTAGILFRTGIYDADLTQSFPHSTTVTLVNNKNPEKSICKTIEKDIRDKKFYDFEICKFEEVEDLVERDSLVCRVVITSQ